MVFVKVTVPTPPVFTIPGIIMELVGISISSCMRLVSWHLHEQAAGKGNGLCAFFKDVARELQIIFN